LASRELVVAHYNEPLDWLEPLRPLASVLIYSKGELVNGSILRPNVGREAHTYLSHIVQVWSCLADWTVFSQGNPADHCPVWRLRYLLLQERKAAIGAKLGWERKNWSDADGRLCWYPWPKLREKVTPAKLSFAEFCWEYLSLDLSQVSSLSYWYGAVFGASRKCIQARPRQFYERLLDLVSHGNHPEEAYYLEQVWPFILGVDTGTAASL